MIATIREEVLHFLGQRPEAVDELGGEGLDVALFFEIGEAAVEAETKLRSPT